MSYRFAPMKSFIILFVAFTMLLKPLWPVVEYVMNYDYIVNVLCENKDKPELKCDGKCYLAQQLAKEARNDKNPFGEKQSKIEVQHLVFYQVPRDFDFGFPASRDLENNFSTVIDLCSSLFTTDISQPPELV